MINVHKHSKVEVRNPSNAIHELRTCMRCAACRTYLFNFILLCSRLNRQLSPPPFPRNLSKTLQPVDMHCQRNQYRVTMPRFAV